MFNNWIFLLWNQWNKSEIHEIKHCEMSVISRCPIKFILFINPFFENGWVDWKRIEFEGRCGPRHNPIQWNWLDWRRVSEWTEWINLFMNEVSERKAIAEQLKGAQSKAKQTPPNNQTQQSLKMIDWFDLFGFVLGCCCWRLHFFIPSITNSSPFPLRRNVWLIPLRCLKR